MIQVTTGDDSFHRKKYCEQKWKLMPKKDDSFTL
jgi:hypothetical protein